MRCSLGCGGFLTCTLSLLTLIVPALGAQLGGDSGSSKGVPSRAAKPWTPPRTPWGDPDIQGTFTNVGMRDVPFERPVELGERSTITDAEFAERKARDEQARRRSLDERVTPSAPVFRGGEQVLSGPTHWAERGNGPSKRTSLMIDPPNGRIPPLTEGARRRAPEAVRRSTAPGPWDGPEDLGLYDRCITRGLPGSMMPAIYGNSYQIVQGPGFVAIRYEMIHETRVIPLDGRPHVGGSIRPYMGDARGRWDGMTLVVETTNFRTPYRGANPERLRFIERFTAVAPDTVEWAVTVDDSTTWITPWTFSVPLTRDDTQSVFEYACHEGNYAMFHILNASRAAEHAGDARPNHK
jgi:hypothetical protein